MAERDPITCHILDTTTGRPAANVSVQLTCVDIPTVFTANTNADGRIANWIPPKESDGTAKSIIERFIVECAETKGTEACPKGSSIWKLVFNTGAYYGADKTFFPTVELTFLVKVGEHFHVPLLLGPYSYTTYRGS